MQPLIPDHGLVFLQIDEQMIRVEPQNYDVVMVLLTQILVNHVMAADKHNVVHEKPVNHVFV